MKRVFSKLAAILAVVVVLVAALTVGVIRSSSAHAASANQQTVSTTKAQTGSSRCGWGQLGSFTWRTRYGNVKIITWLDTCNADAHCQAIDESYHGYLDHVGIHLELDVTDASGLSESTHVNKYPFSVGQTVNTPSLNVQGAFAFGCNPSVIHG